MSSYVLAWIIGLALVGAVVILALKNPPADDDDEDDDGL